jgi:hypothetical protein
MLDGLPTKGRGRHHVLPIAAMRLLVFGCLLSLAAAASSGCGDSVDDRPASRAYIVSAILGPSCANAGCHSSAANTSGYAFGTQAEAQDALSRLVVAGSPTRSQLLRLLRSTDGKRMPLDAPLPDDDIALIEKWIQDGAP